MVKVIRVEKAKTVDTEMTDVPTVEIDLRHLNLSDDDAQELAGPPAVGAAALSIPTILRV
jgi:hypothetical protein